MSTELESVEEFRRRARRWIETNMARKGPEKLSLKPSEARALQAEIFDAGFAGIAMPIKYGGQGLTLQHQEAWAEEVSGHQLPDLFVVTVAMVAVTVLEHATEPFKEEHLPRMLRGEEIWVQLMSEPSGGSDMAAVMTKATRGDENWCITGEKVWTTRADEADYGLCLARTNWDAPKHRGLSMFAVPLSDPRITMRPILGSDGGATHFFQEFLDGVVVPAANLIGGENDGWRVAHTQLLHQRNAISGVGYGLGVGDAGSEGRGGSSHHGVSDLIAHAERNGTIDDPTIRALIAEAYIHDAVQVQVSRRVTPGIRKRQLTGDWGSVLKLGLGENTLRRAEIGLIISGPDGIVWEMGPNAYPTHEGRAWLVARNMSIGGGTNEIQRNTISERILAMPPEPAVDREVPFSQLIATRNRKTDGT
jgi:alkylation response protein AidB-like acyl-CoA dehydrogenase